MFNLPRLGKRIEEILGGFGNQAQRTLGNVGNQAQRGINQIQRQATNTARQNVNVINQQVQQVQRQVPQVDFTQLSRRIANAANPVNQVNQQFEAVKRIGSQLPKVDFGGVAKNINDISNNPIVKGATRNLAAPPVVKPFYNAFNALDSKRTNDIVDSGGNFVKDMAVATARAVPQGLVRYSNQLSDGFNSKTASDAQEQMLRQGNTSITPQNKEYKPNSSVEKFIFGDKPIGNMQDYANETANVVGIDKLHPAVGLPLGFALTAGDVFVTGGGKKAVTESLSKADDAKKVLQVINKDKNLAKLTDDVKASIAPQLAKITDTKQIDDVLQQAFQSKPKVTLNVPENPLLNEARKYKSADEFVKAKSNMYHGSQQPLEKLDFNRKAPGNELPYGVHFTQDKALASDFASGATKGKPTGSKGIVNSASIDVKNPLDTTKIVYKQGTKEYQVLKEIADKSGLKGMEKPYSTKVGFLSKPGSLQDSIAIDSKLVLDNANPKIVKQALLDNGYDPAIRYKMLGTKDPLGGGVPTYTDAIAVLDKSAVKTKAQLTNLYNQATKGVESKGVRVTDTKKALAEGFMDIDTADPVAVRGVFDNAGYVDRGGYKVHPDVDPRWVDDLSPETRQLMADEGITYIDASPDQNASAMAVKKNLGGNEVKGISVNSKKDAGLFTNKDPIIAHEIGHHKWNQLSPAEKAEWGNRPAQSEYGKRIEAGHQHSGAMKGEEEFAEQFAAQHTGRYGGGGKPVAPVESKGKPKVELKQPDVPVKTGVDRVKEIIGETPQVRNARMVRNEAVTLGKTIEPLISQETKLAKVARKYQSELNKLVKLKPSPRVNNKIALRSTKLQSVLGELEQVTPQVKTLKNQRRALAREATGLKGSTPDMTPEQRAKNVELENRRREILGQEQLAQADVGGNVGGFVAKSQGLQDKIAGGMRTLETKEGVIPRTVAKGVRTLVGTSGKSSDQMFQTKKLRSSISNLTEDLNNEYKALTDGYSKESLQRVAWKLDPAVAKQKNVKLNEQEQVLANKLRELADIEHTQAYLSGTITKEQYEKGLGKYLTRAYESKEFGTPEELDALAQWSGYKIDNSLSKRRKNVSEGMVKDQFDDPAFKLMKQRQFTETNRIVSDYQQWLSKSGMVINDAKPGYSRLPESAGWGDVAGKYVPNSVFEDITGFHFGNEAAQSLYNLAGQWERLGPRRWRKMALTIMNPAVRFINKEFNSALAFGGGVNNLVEYRVGLSRAIKDIKVGTKGDIGTMKRLGLFSGNNTREEMMQTVKQLKANGKTNAAVELIKKLGDSYGRVDDAGKVAYVRYMMKNKGLSMESAVKQAQRYFQDYSSVGLLWDISAKTPIAGKPFGRFLGDFMFRILPNSIQDRPMRAIGLLGAMYGLQHIASTASGETAEDRKTRENRIGAGKVPILGMSTEFQTPWGAVDIRRLIGVSGAVSSGEGDPGVAEIMPFQSNPIMTNQYTGEREMNPNFFGSDPLIGPAIQAKMDRDFRGKPIADPNAAGTDKFSGVAESAQPEGEGRNNTLNFLRTAYAPSYVNEMENLANTIQGKPTIYGSKRTPGQQLTRMTVGVRTETFGPEEAKDRRETQKWLTEKKELDDIIKGMPKAKQEAFKRVSGYYKLREKVPNEFEPGTDRWKKAPVFNFSEDKWKEYTSNPELYDVMVAQKEKERLRSIEENKKDPNIKVKPIQPEFDKRLSGGFRKQLINNKSLAPGEDVEADERMYSHSEWDAYQKIKEEYKKAAAAYYPKSDDEFVDEMVKHKQADFPKKGAAKQKYDDAYALYAAGQGSKPAYNDAVNADKEAYNEAKRTWTNNERKARGLDPISKEMWDNVTFGYESDEEKVYKELKYGKGYGGYSKYSKGGGSGGGSGSDGFNPYKYNVALKAGKINKPTVKMLAGGTKISAVKSGAPKVSIKKSKV